MLKIKICKFHFKQQSYFQTEETDCTVTYTDVAQTSLG